MTEVVVPMEQAISNGRLCTPPFSTETLLVVNEGSALAILHGLNVARWHTCRNTGLLDLDPSVTRVILDKHKSFTL
jgi:hypothetical protein